MVLPRGSMSFLLCIKTVSGKRYDQKIKVTAYYVVIRVWKRFKVKSSFWYEEKKLRNVSIIFLDNLIYFNNTHFLTYIKLFPNPFQ